MFTANYDPNGKTTPTTTITQNVRFPGQHADATNLNYNEARNYLTDFALAGGRMPEVDPLGLGGGINPYIYAGNNAYKNIDPSGQVIIQVEYKPTPWYARLFYPKSYHAYIVVTDNTGNGQQTYFRAGPGEEEGLYLNATWGAYGPGTPDWVTPSYTQTVLSTMIRRLLTLATSLIFRMR